MLSRKVGEIPKVVNNTDIGVNNGERSVLPRKAPRRCCWLRAWNTFPARNSNRADQFRRMFIHYFSIISTSVDHFSVLAGERKMLMGFAAPCLWPPFHVNVMSWL